MKRKKENPKTELTKSVKEFARREGAPLIGIAPIERFEGAPSGHHPLDWIPNAKSVVVIGAPILPHVIAYERLLSNSFIYFDTQLRKDALQGHFYDTSGRETLNLHLENVGYRVSCLLEGEGFGTLFFPVTYSNLQKDIQNRVPNRFGLFSHRHAAVRAGLGEFGKVNVVITPEYGPRVRWTSIITEAELVPDPIIKKKVCLDNCTLCVERCGANAICLLPSAKTHDDPWINPVSRTNIDMCWQNRKKNFCDGRCIRVCPVKLKPSLKYLG
jgi:epoxyqueuosine reductase